MYNANVCIYVCFISGWEGEGGRQRSRYRDPIQLGRFKVRIPVGQQTSSFPHWSGLALGLTQPSVQRVPGFSSGGKAARIWCWPPVSSITKVHTGFSYYFTAPPHVQGMRHLVPGVQKSRVTELYTKAPNICGTSVWNSVYVTHLAL